MKVQTLTPSFRRALPPVSIRQEGPSQPPPSPEPEGPPSVLKSALLGAGYGALVGAGTALLYQHQPLMTATGYHMAGIAAGGLAGAPLLGWAKPCSPRSKHPLLTRWGLWPGRA